MATGAEYTVSDVDWTLESQLDEGWMFQGRMSSMQLVGCPAAMASGVALTQA